MSRFLYVLPYTLGHEGGKANHPSDPGGRTNQGVTQRVFTRWLSLKGKPARDVFGMTNDERNAIYREFFWDVIQGNLLPAGLDLTVFDGAVNSGPTQSVKWLQRALGSYYKGSIDGQMGRLTLDAVSNYPDTKKLVNAVNDRRLAFLQALSTFKVFGKGWARRVSDVRNKSLIMVTGGQPIALASTTSDASQKARIEDAKAIPGTSAANATAATGGSNVGIAVAINQTKDALEPYVGTSNYIQWLVIVLIVSGAALTIGGFIWRHFANRKAKKLIDDLNLLTEPADHNARVA